MRIQNNIAALNSHRQYSINNSAIAKSVEKLSSGYRINRAGDDAAGLAISEKMRGQIRGLNMASKNAQDGISLIQTAEGGLQSTHNILQRMRELAVQSANDTNQTEIDREALDLEFQHLKHEIDDVADKTEFNKMTLLNGEFSNKVLQIGANSGDELHISIAKMDTTALGKIGTGTAFVYDVGAGTVQESEPEEALGDTTDYTYGATLSTTSKYESNNGFANVGTQESASAAISIVDSAINIVSQQRASLGALQNRLEYKISNLDTSAENLQAAESRIRDVDMAKEMTTFMKNNILSQASTAMLAQANSLSQGVLSLLG